MSLRKINKNNDDNQLNEINNQLQSIKIIENVHSR
jgi:hypothetical protein